MDSSKIVEIIAASGWVPDMTGFNPDQTFRQNNIDSLDVMSIFLAVEEKLGIKFTEEEANQINSVAEMVAVIKSRSISPPA